MENKVLLEIEGLGQIITTADKIDTIWELFRYASSHAWSLYRETDDQRFYKASMMYNKWSCKMLKYLDI